MGNHTHPPPPPPPAAAPLNLRLLAAAVIAAAVLAAYGNSLPAPFLFDDQINITDNPYIRLTRLSLEQLERAMVQDRNQLRPISNLTFGLDFYFHGLNPKAMHLENAAIHAAAALLLFGLLVRLRPRSAPADDRRTLFAAAFGAAVWALSPAHSQAVTYLVQRHTLMAAALTLASCYCWVRGRQDDRGRGAWFAGAGLCFALAAGSKESGFLTPLFWLLLEPLLRAAPAARVNRRLLAAAAGVVAMSGAVLMGALALNGMLARFLQTYHKLGYGPGARLLTEARIAVSYLVTILLPVPSRLALDHEVVVSAGLFTPGTTAPAVAAIIAALAAALALYRRRPALTVCIIGFLLALAPESTIVPVELMNDHRMYLASLFVAAPLGFLAALRLAERRSLPVLCAILVLLGGLTALRNRTWSDPVKLWADSAAKSPSLYRPWSNLCGALTAAGEFRAALPACDAAIARNPPGPIPLINRGIARMRLDAADGAGSDFAEAARRWPGSAEARFNYAAFLYTAGRDNEALAEVSRSLALDQFFAPAYLLRARLSARMGRPAQARADLALLLRLYPENEEARRMMGEVGSRE